MPLKLAMGGGPLENRGEKRKGNPRGIALFLDANIPSKTGLHFFHRKRRRTEKGPKQVMANAK